jgi:hypothetical protein
LARRLPRFFGWNEGHCQSQEFVTCHLAGQLGNQLFQIAAVIEYALENGCEARFPTLKEAKDGEENSRYILHRLNTAPFPEGTTFESFSVPGERLYSPIAYQGNKNLCFDGFYQSEKFFRKHAEAIRDLFGPTDEILVEIHQKYGKILQEPTVAVHVRTFIPDGWDPHQMVQMGYYLTAMNHFPIHSHFLVFSDAMEWTRRFFPKGGRKVTFIEGNPPHIDFYLMSLCDHQIVSCHSTFSWWAAWLNKNPNKIVIAADLTRRTRITDDFLPDSWIKR